MIIIRDAGILSDKGVRTKSGIPKEYENKIDSHRRKLIEITNGLNCQDCNSGDTYIDYNLKISTLDIDNQVIYCCDNFAQIISDLLAKNGFNYTNTLEI